MSQIKSIAAREILDSRGIPTLETKVTLSDDLSAVASVPAGMSVGRYEASELRDHDESRNNGLGVLKAVENVNKIISPQLVGMEVNLQGEIDKRLIDLDGTGNKAKLGANTILSVSVAVAKAAAKSFHMELYEYIHAFLDKGPVTTKMPTPLFNLINGGMHAGNNVDFQEFHVVPASFKKFAEAMKLGIDVYSNLKKLLQQNNMTTLLGDEGGFAPNFATNDDAFALLAQAISNTNLRLGYDVFMGLDAAAGTFYKSKEYRIKDKGMSLSSFDLVTYYEDLIKKYHILYLEDPFEEDDWEGWSSLNKTISTETIVSGDDLTATNPIRLSTVLSKKLISGIIIKPNQIGTVIETLAVVSIAKQAGLKIIVSHRSGETNDDFIADFAVGVGADYVKFGAPARGERVAKYNRLLQIDSSINKII